MLGRKSSPDSAETLSQGTFVKSLLPLLSGNAAADANLLKNQKPPGVYPKLVFNEYFRKEKDSQILKILLNVFRGARNTWNEEWNDSTHFVLTKTLGFSGIMKALPDLVDKGRKKGDLSEEYFTTIFGRVKSLMDARHITLSSDHFSASASGEAEFRNLILEAAAD
jgi:hypothetical protein